jgi:hypothetical protein
MLHGGEELRQASGHFGYLVFYDDTNVSPITSRMRKASQRYGGRAPPILFL